MFELVMCFRCWARGWTCPAKLHAAPGQDCGASDVLAAPHPLSAPAKPPPSSSTVHPLWQPFEDGMAPMQPHFSQGPSNKQLGEVDTFCDDTHSSVSSSRTNATVIDGCRAPVLLLLHPSDAIVTKRDERRKAIWIRDRCRSHTLGVLLAKQSIFLPHNWRHLNTRALGRTTAAASISSGWRAGRLSLTASRAIRDDFSMSSSSLWTGRCDVDVALLKLYAVTAFSLW